MKAPNLTLERERILNQITQTEATLEQGKQTIGRLATELVALRGELRCLDRLLAPPSAKKD